jgi:SNF family Na+-dependent transporter
MHGALNGGWASADSAPIVLSMGRNQRAGRRIIIAGVVVFLIGIVAGVYGMTQGIPRAFGIAIPGLAVVFWGIVQYVIPEKKHASEKFKDFV